MKRTALKLIMQLGIPVIIAAHKKRQAQKKLEVLDSRSIEIPTNESVKIAEAKVRTTIQKANAATTNMAAPTPEEITSSWHANAQRATAASMSIDPLSSYDTKTVRKTHDCHKFTAADYTKVMDIYKTYYTHPKSLGHPTLRLVDMTPIFNKELGLNKSMSSYRVLITGEPIIDKQQDA